MATTRLLLLLSILLLSLSVTSCKPACPIYSCEVRMMHRHGEQEYRGMPFYRKQHLKMGQELPKQKGEVPKKRANDKSTHKN
ncbi:hypothetical protein [Pontibacter ruber]|uniref:Secreted protein n=1 Tax=Pontibacter ruber TaxID=1343895 RepID=A0ABW5CSU9_9BACT|nr:hypothetical protein [Pontibacter ruber]